MYFDFADRRFDTPTIESAMSWRERSLLALFAHILVAVLVFVVPELQFVKDAATRREERLAEMIAEQQLALLEERQDAPDFIFVTPLVDIPALEPPPQADFSDIDRLAAAPTQAEDPVNDLPNADGNSPDFVVAEDPSIGVDPAVESGEALEVPEVAVAEPVQGVDDGASDAPEPEPDVTPGDGGAPADSFLVDRGEASRETPRERLFTERPGTIFRQALRGLEGVARVDSFKELQGRTDQYGSDIEFDTKGVDFGSLDSAFPRPDLSQLAPALRHLVDVRSRRADVQRAPGRDDDRLDGDRALRGQRFHELRPQCAPELEPAAGIAG